MTPSEQSSGERVLMLEAALVEAREQVARVLALDAMSDADDEIFDGLNTLNVYLGQKAFRPTGTYCLCSDPDYCLRGASSEHRKAAVAYRRAHGAAVPLSEETRS